MDLDKIKQFRELQNKIDSLKNKPSHDIERLSLENQLIKLQIEDLTNNPKQNMINLVVGSIISLVSAILGAVLSHYLQNHQ